MTLTDLAINSFIIIFLIRRGCVGLSLLLALKCTLNICI